LDIWEWIPISLFLLTVSFICGAFQSYLENRQRNKEVRAIQKRVSQINKQRDKLRKIVNAK